MNQDIPEKIDELVKERTSLVLATTDPNGNPVASQTPYALDEDGNFLILVSGLAEHGKNLPGMKKVNIMLMEDESGLANPFARKRLSYSCHVEMIEPGSDARTRGEELLEQRFGKFVQTLFSLPDFSMYRLSPVNGRFVAGFGAAYTIENGRIEQVRR